MTHPDPNDLENLLREAREELAKVKRDAQEKISTWGQRVSEMQQKEELLGCARINFENLERDRPDVARHPFYRIAKAQMDEALGGMTMEERFALDVKRAERKAP